jgi:HEAT repeat protein
VTRFLLSLTLLSLLALSPKLLADGEEPSVGGKKLSEWLTQLQDGKSSKDRRRAAIAVDLIGATRSRKVVPALIKALREDREPEVREKAAIGIGKGASAILNAAREEKKEELPRIDDARDALCVALRSDSSEKVRESAARGLAILGADARGAAGPLGTALKDASPNVVAGAADALRRLGKEAAEAQGELLVLLANKKADPQVRATAAFTLGQIAPEPREVLPTFKDVLGEPKAAPALVKSVIESIGKLGREGAELIPAVTALLNAKETPPDARLAVVTMLDGLGPDAKTALPALIPVTKDSDRYVRGMALHAIGRLGKEIEPQRKPTVEAVLAALEDSSAEVRLAAIECLVALGVDGLHTETTEAVKRLRELSERETRKEVREAAVAAMEKILPKK